MTIVTIDYEMSGNPIPHRSDVLYHVQLDNWDPFEAAQDPDLPPRQVTYRDGVALHAAAKARRQVLSYRLRSSGTATRSGSTTVHGGVSQYDGRFLPNVRYAFSLWRWLGWGAQIRHGITS